jgi:trans-aconitate 2-methyltransferase
MRVVDLGCGTGELTRELHRRLGAKETLGIDNSETMLARSAPFSGEGLRFAAGDIASFSSPEPFDLVFSNAALQWLPGHEALLGRLAKLLRPGGQLAVQVPANDDHPSHTTAFELSQDEQYRSALGGYRREWPVLRPEQYAAILDQLGFGEQHVRLQVYGHHLASREDVVEWVRGTLLTDYQSRMEPELFAQFLEEYRSRLRGRLEDSQPYFYNFKRVLFWGRLPGG